jgi:hypothetical protein
MSFFEVQTEDLVAAGALVANSVAGSGAGGVPSGALAGTPAESEYEEFVSAVTGALGSAEGAVRALSGALRATGGSYQSSEDWAASQMEA